MIRLTASPFLHRWFYRFLLAVVVALQASTPSRAVAALPGLTHVDSLNGAWSFRYVEGLDAGAVGSFHQPGFDVSDWASIKVPANWELEGFAEPRYALKLADGLGLYRRTFEVDPEWRGERVFLRFEGVAFGFELWLNGAKIGASTASAFNRHTFEVTDHLHWGAGATNTLALQVTTKPLGWEFDANDDWALSGIYRDVTLYAVPATHFQDVATQTQVLDAGAAQLTVDVAVSQAGEAIQGRLLAPDGALVSTFAVALDGVAGRVTVRVPAAQLWTAETPWLYTLELNLREDGRTVHGWRERIGLREITVSGKQFLVNGRPVKLRGVNRHDLAPDVGRAVTERHFRRDLEVMKQGNINFIRTSHYPPHPRFIELCDELGFYVMCEVSIGKGEEHLDDPAYRANILARAEATVERDKNRPSVIIWSIGNENPVTEVEMAAGRRVKDLDPSRPICIPKIGTYFADNYQLIPEFVDVHSPHYPDVAMLKQFAATLDRPTILTEYAHALGLATDRIQEEWEIIQASECLAGGAIWHFMDQGILRTNEAGIAREEDTRYVWLDAHTYYDTNGVDGADGLVYSDRRPQTDFWLTRKVYAPVQIHESEVAVTSRTDAVKLTVENRFDFISLAGKTLRWSLERNGQAMSTGSVALRAASRETERVSIPVAGARTHPSDVVLLALEVHDESGASIIERNVRLRAADEDRIGWAQTRPAQEPLKVTESAASIEVSSPTMTVRVDRATGQVQVRDAEDHVVIEGLYPRTARQLTMAEARNAKKTGLWTLPYLSVIEQPETRVERRADGVRLSVRGRYPQPDQPEQALNGEFTVDIQANGTLSVNYNYSLAEAEGLLSEAGLTVVLPREVEEFRWIGRGPYAGYPGKDRLSEFGLWHLNRDDLYFRGNRRAVEAALLTTAAGRGVALLAEASDVAAERTTDRMLLGHNAVIGSLGNKFRPPEVRLQIADLSTLQGSFRLLVLGTDWPEPVRRWFGEPQAASEVNQPYFNSYDK